MYKLSLAVALLLPASALCQQPADLEKQIRKAQEEIEAVRGLKFKAPVNAKVIPRPAGAAAGVQGYYSTKDKALYLYDDIRGNYQRGVLIHELVHALQDQHFGLDKLHQTDFGSDAERARAALIEGDATYTMIEVLKKDQPKVAAMLDVPLEKAKNLDNAFLYAQGARYVAALKKRGGWPAVNFAYKFPPRSTAAILNPDGGSTIHLGQGKSVGAFAAIKLLVGGKGVPTEEAVTAVRGWKADRQTKEGGAATWVVAFAEPKQAERFRDALVKERHGGSKFPLRKQAEGVWHAEEDGKVIFVVAVLLRGDRVVAIDAPDAPAFRRALDRADGPLAVSAYCRKTKNTIPFSDFIDRLLEADIVCVGETHDSEPHHRAQLSIIKHLFARDERLAVGLEMFQRPYQAALDRYLSGKIDDAAMLKESEYKERWGYDWGLYKPIAEFCRRNAVPLAALNVSTELRRRISKVGHDKLTDDEKKQLGPIDFHVKAHRDHWYERLSAMHGNTKATPEQKERGYQVMTVWDEYMADSAAKFQKERGVRRMVVLAGTGHIERGFGIPDRAARRTGGRAVTVGIVEGEGPKAGAEVTTDYVLIVR